MPLRGHGWAQINASFPRKRVRGDDFYKSMSYVQTGATIIRVRPWPASAGIRAIRVSWHSIPAQAFSAKT